MSYATAHALRTALEDPLHNRSTATGVSLDRLRRRVLFERIVARLQASAPGLWVLKGGMALEVRLGDEARLTKDLDLGLRSEVESATALHELLIEALGVDREGDRFEFAAAAPQLLAFDGAGHPTWRVSVGSSLAGRNFGAFRLDVSPRPHELAVTEQIVLLNSLDFAGIPATTAEVVDVNRHAAEKLHAMCRDFGDREKTRVRDVVDIVLLAEHGLLTPARLGACVRQVWAERDGVEPPIDLPSFPESWPVRYERLAAEQKLGAGSFESASSGCGRSFDDSRGGRTRCSRVGEVMKSRTARAAPSRRGVRNVMLDSP
jgi:predicted nucleotidyltransferase component of viral defense system